MDNKINCTTECNVYSLSEAELRRVEQVLLLHIKRIDEKLDLHIIHAEKMSGLECSRINAVREMDTKAYNSALDQASEQRIAISNRMSSINDTLRNLISASEDVISKQFEQRMDQNSDRITLLERNQYQTQGKAQTSSSVIAFIAVLVGAVLTMGLQRFFFMGK